MDIREMKQEIERIVVENDKLNYIKGQYIELSKKLIDISEEIKIIALSIDPMAANKKERKNNRWLYMKCYDMLMDGKQITREYIKNEFLLDKTTSHNIMQALKKMDNVECVKDGRILRLFKKVG